MMKKLPNPTHDFESFEGIRLFRDDIEHVMATFKQRSLEVRLTDNDYEYEQLQELIDKRGVRPRHLRCSGENRDAGFENVSVSIEKATARLSCYGDERIRSIWFELKDFLSKRVPWHYRVLNPWYWGLVALLLANIDLQLLTDKKADATVPLSLHVIVFVFFAFFVVSLVDRRTNFGLVLRPRYEGGFWRRNTDKLVLLGLGALIGAAIKVGVDWIVGRIGTMVP